MFVKDAGVVKFFLPTGENVTNGMQDVCTAASGS
jgi:hypothetical protein